MFVDDGITGHKNFRVAKMAAVIVQSDLRSAGFVINFEKSDFNPTHLGTWLGTIVDTKTMTFSVPEKKMLSVFIEQVVSKVFIG